VIETFCAGFFFGAFFGVYFTAGIWWWQSEGKMLLACNDPVLMDWLHNASDERRGAGSFVKFMAQAGLRADAENYAILRPALLQYKIKYPQYNLPAWKQ
jgi:hypothetical protein